MRDRGRVQFRLMFRAAPDDARAFRGKGPFVQIADIPIDAERRHIDRHLPRRVRPVHHDRDAAPTANCGQFGDRHDDRADRGDVIETGEPCLRPDRRFERDEQWGGILERHRDRQDNHASPAPLRVIAQRIRDGAIDLREADQLVARREPDRRDDCVEAGRRILDEGPVFAATAQETGDASRGVA